MVAIYAATLTLVAATLAVGASSLDNIIDDLDSSGIFLSHEDMPVLTAYDLGSQNQASCPLRRKSSAGGDPFDFFIRDFLVGGYEHQLEVHEQGLKSVRAKIQEAKEKRRRATDRKSKKFWKNELESANEMMEYEKEEIEQYTALIGHI